ncbi:MAG: M50 family metallopeptidase [Fusobacteriaceae bacterium]
MEVLVALLVLGVIILVHELGHFLAAKFFGMPVTEFAIGMGPDVYSYQGDDTRYSFRAIPMGGFVNIAGMEIDSKEEDGFNSKPAYQRFVVLFAGVFMNFILAYMIIFSILAFNGKGIQNEKPLVGDIVKNVRAEKVLQKNDMILSINDKKIEKWQDISEVLKIFNEETQESTVAILLERDGEQKNVQAELTYDEEGKRYYLGIMPEIKVEKYSFKEIFPDSGKVFGKIFGQTFGGFKQLFSGKVKKEEISGPLGIIKVVGDASRGGFTVLLWLTVMLSVNVGIFNLLPFPALDGGRIIFVLLELVGIKVDKKLEEKVHMAGMVILIGFIVYITGNDIFNMVKR